MFNTHSFLANVYSGVSPAFNLATVACRQGYECVSPAVDGAMAAFMFVFFLGFIAVLVLIVVSMWKIFQKAGQPGWTSIIPVYSLIIEMRIIKKPSWWILLLFIPIVSLVVNVIILYDLARAFGKGAGFMLGLLFLPFIFYPILAFGDAKYTAPVDPAQPAVA